MVQGWRKVTIGDIADVKTGGTPNRNKSTYWNGGTIPWLTTSCVDYCVIYEAEEFITEAGLKDSAARIFPSGTLLMAMYGQGVTRGKVAILGIDASFNQACAAILLNRTVDRDFVFYYLQYKYEELRELGHGGNQKNLNTSLIKSIPIHLPPLPEQQKIAAILKTWDEAIEKTEQLISQKEKRLQHVRTLLINDVKHGRKPISDIAIEKSERNRGGSIVRVLSVTNKNGFVLPEDQFQRRVASEDVSNYKIVRRGEYAYNPSRINVGSIARLDDYDDGILSPMYIVFSLNSKKVNSDYFLNWLSSSEAQQRIRNAAQGSVRETVGFSDLCSIKIPLPDLATQKKIVEILRTAQMEICNLQDTTRALKSQKRGLMQKLLTGEWRVKVDGKAMEAA